MTACSSENKGDGKWGVYAGEDKGEFVEGGLTKPVRVATLLSNETNEIFSLCMSCANESQRGDEAKHFLYSLMWALGQ